MLRMTAAALGCALAVAAAGPAEADRLSVSGNGCEVIRILADGREIRSRSMSGTALRKGRSGRSASSVSVRSGSGSAHSSASASSSSGSRSSSRAVSSVTGEDGRTVTTTRDDNGCTIVIDER